MNLTELANNNGKNGNPAYVAVSGNIYDVSNSPMWRDGNHVDKHQAGEDLTEALKTAPHVRTVIERFPMIGRLEKETANQTKKKSPLFLIVGLIVLLIVVAALLL